MARRRLRSFVVTFSVLLAFSSAAGPAAAVPLRPVDGSPGSGEAVGRQPAGGSVSLNADPTPTTVLPFQGTGYRYLVVAAGGGPADFMQPGFNDSAFATGQAGFGSGGGCAVQGTRHTTWPTNTDILLRRTIDLPPNTTDVTITGGIDNDLFIYWNGELLGQRFHEGCPTPTDFTVPVPQTAVTSGSNVLAVRARDRGVESWVDLSVTAVLHPLTAPGANAGPDQGVIEGSVVHLDGSASTDPSGAPLSYSWALAGRTGPAITLSSTASPTPTFQTLDDGTYRFALTVSNGAETSTDEVVVTVTNANPVLSVQADPAYEKSVALITTTFTDAGILDTHHGVLDWGDGSGPQNVPVDAQGSGWGTLVASHVYASAGSFNVSISVVDDDGGTATTAVAGFSVVVPVAIWANSNSTDAAMEATSGAVTFEGLVHTNDDLRVRGGQKTFHGPVEYVRTLDLGGTPATFDTQPVKVAVAPFPIRFNIADYRPAGRAAVVAGSTYHDMSSSCGTNGVWQVNGSALASGIYYATCAVKLNGNPIGGTITVAAEGDITVSGSGAFFDPYLDGLLFLSNSNSTSAIRIDAANSTFFGYSYAERGRIVLTGAGDKVYCGILADRIDISSQSLLIHGSACSRPNRTVAPPTIVPALSLGLAVDKADALPANALTHTAVITNTGSTIVVPGILGLENLGTSSASVTGHELALEYLSATDHAWHALPGGITTNVRPNAYPGVTYPGGSDAIDGTTIPAGALASWGYAAVVQLNAVDTAFLLNPAQVAAIRVRSTFTTNPAAAPVRRLFRFGDDFAGQLRALGADAANVQLTIVPPAGDAATITSSTVPALAHLGPGQSATVAKASTVPVPAARGATELDAAYLARLQSLDGTPLVGTAFAGATAGIGPVLAPSAIATTTRHLPVVSLDKTGPADLEPGTTALYALDLQNGGSAEARGIGLTDSLAGIGTVPVTGAPTTLAAAASATAHASYPVPGAITNTTLANTGSVRWSDAAGNAYGPVNDSLTTRLIAARKLIVTKTDAASVVGGQFLVDYDVSITNVGAQTITGIDLSDHLDPYTTLVPGSVRTSQGTITTGDDPSDVDVAIDVGTLPSGGTVSIGFRARLTGTVPEGMNGISNQATVTSDQLDPILSDDPEGPGATDPTFTAVVGTGTGGGSGGGGELAHPSIGDTTPADGTVITVPTEVSAVVTPADGFNVASWSISIRPVGGTADTVLATDTITGEGPVTATATVDPTILANGTYLVSVTAVSSDGGTQTSTTSLIVDGNLKLGRYKTTYQDLSVGIAGLPMQVLRTYDSFDKSVGDFGVGWNVELANFRVQVSRPLGYGGWVQETFGCGFIFCQTRYHSTTPHIVTVVWPDGHQEIFDLTPANGSTFFAPATAAGFTGRARTTSTLQADLDTSLSFFGDGNLYGGGFGSGGVYDPQRFRLTAKDGTVYVLDRTAGLVSATDRNGNTLTVTANGITSSLGPSIAFTRDGLGRITAIAGPGGEHLSYGYDPAGDLVTYKDAADNTLSYSYGPNHDLVQSTDPDHHPFRTYTYEDGRLATITDGGGNTTHVDVDVDARTQTVIDPTGRSTTINTFDDLGDIIRVDQVADGQALTTRITYDSLGRPITTIDPAGNETSAAWDDDGNLIRYTDAGHNAWTITYDEFGAPLSASDPDSHQIVTFAYDERGNLVGRSRPGGRQETFAYDGAGRMTSASDNAGHDVDLVYAPSGDISHIDGPGDQSRTYTHDAAGRVLTVTENGGVTAFTYDPNGNVLTVTDALTHQQSFTYDVFHRLLTETDGLARTTTYTYDLAGRRTSRHDRNGATVAYAYDAAGRMTVKTLPGNDVTTYTYDGFGRLVSAIDGDSRLDFAYDTAGDLVSQRSRGVGVSLPDVTMNFAYSRPGVPSTVSTPAGVTTYGFDDRLRLTTVDGPAAGPISLSYDVADRLLGVNRPNGVADTLTWNSADELVSRISRLAGAPIATSTYAYDDEANRLSLVDDVGTHTFGYDAFGRLLSADQPEGSSVPDEAYTYDLVGNRTSWIGSPASTVSYDAGNRLRSDGTYDYLYDNEGDLTRRTSRTSGAVTSYDWNADHQLLAVHLPGGATVAYRYDALGRRVEAAGGGSTARYAYLGTNVALEYDAANTLTASYVTGFRAGEVYSRTAGGSTSFYLQDGLGSTVALTNGSGAVNARFTYGAFGQPGTGVGGVYAYSGMQFDAATGLYYARARYYDPATGRFISEDPVPAINAFAYANGDPVSMVDPSGRQSFIETVVAYARGFGGGSVIGGLAYLGGGAFLNVIQGRGPTEGLTIADLLIAMASGGLSAIVGPGLLFFERVLMNSIIGFVATTWSMIIGGRSSSTELFLGTVFGGFGAINTGGEGANGFFRALFASGTVSGLQSWVTQFVDSLFGPPPSGQLQPVP